MEIPVMTSASTHGLRSACAKPSTSYLTSSTYSGGCLKKIIDTVKKSDGSAFLNEVNLTKKRKASNDTGALYKKEKNLGGKVCPTQYLSPKHRNGKIKNIHGRSYADEKYAKGFLNSFPKSVKVSDEIFSKIKSKDFFDKKINGVAGEVSANPKAKSWSKSEETNVKCQGPALATPALNDNHENSNIDNVEYEGKKNYGFDFGAINTKPHNNVSISDVDLKREDCVKSEFMIVSDEREKTEVGIGENEGNLIFESERLVSRGTLQIAREPVSLWHSGSEHPFAIASQVSPKIQVGKTVECAGRDVLSEENYQLVAECGYTPTFYDAGISQATPTSKQLGKNGGSHQQIRRIDKLSKTMCKYDVFLGGSCNPTTWRTDIAIPDLDRMGITYFNPVSKWKPELMEVEYHAKENAAIMFFVIDNQTRGVTALIEVAHIAGSKRNLILVIQSYTQEKQMICGEVISQEEYEDLRDGQQVLQDLVESQGIPVFDNIRVALKRTEKLLGKSSGSDEETDGKEALRVVPSPKQIEVREAFEAVATGESGKISVKDACLAFQLLTQKQITPAHEKCIGEILGVAGKDKPLEERAINLEEFQLAVSGLRAAQDSEEQFQGYDYAHHHRIIVKADSFFVEYRPWEVSIVVNTLNILTNSRIGTLLPKIASDTSALYTRDIFLGGTYKDTCWKKDIAIPLLKQNGLSYFNPTISEWSERFSAIEAAAMNASYMLLFVITNSARSIAEMAVAGHYIGLGARMVLCVQQLPEELTVGPDKLSENAVKDYNRGRLYLADIAKRNGVKIFDRIKDAVECAIEECKQR